MDEKLLNKKLRALINPDRRAILKILSELQSIEGSVTSGILQEKLKISQASLSEHLRKLEKAGMIVGIQSGRYSVWAYRIGAMLEVVDALEGFMRIEELRR